MRERLAAWAAARLGRSGPATKPDVKLPLATDPWRSWVAALAAETVRRLRRSAHDALAFADFEETRLLVLSGPDTLERQDVVRRLWPKHRVAFVSCVAGGDLSRELSLVMHASESGAAAVLGRRRATARPLLVAIESADVLAHLTTAEDAAANGPLARIARYLNQAQRPPTVLLLDDAYASDREARRLRREVHRLTLAGPHRLGRPPYTPRHSGVVALPAIEPRWFHNSFARSTVGEQVRAAAHAGWSCARQALASQHRQAQVALRREEARGARPSSSRALVLRVQALQGQLKSASAQSCTRGMLASLLDGSRSNSRTVQARAAVYGLEGPGPVVPVPYAFGAVSEGQATVDDRAVGTYVHGPRGPAYGAEALATYVAATAATVAGMAASKVSGHGAVGLVELGPVSGGTGRSATDSVQTRTACSAAVARQSKQLYALAAAVPLSGPGLLAAARTAGYTAADLEAVQLACPWTGTWLVDAVVASTLGRRPAQAPRSSRPASPARPACAPVDDAADAEVVKRLTTAVRRLCRARELSPALLAHRTALADRTALATQARVMDELSQLDVMANLDYGQSGPTTRAIHEDIAYHAVGLVAQTAVVGDARKTMVAPEVRTQAFWAYRKALAASRVSARTVYEPLRQASERAGPPGPCRPEPLDRVHQPALADAAALHGPYAQWPFTRQPVPPALTLGGVWAGLAATASLPVRGAPALWWLYVAHAVLDVPLSALPQLPAAAATPTVWAACALPKGHSLGSAAACLSRWAVLHEEHETALAAARHAAADAHRRASAAGFLGVQGACWPWCGALLALWQAWPERARSWTLL